MPKKKNINSTPGDKLLRFFRLLMLDGKRHYQKQLADIFECSPQTIIRLAAELEEVIGGILVKGLDSHKRWYQIKSLSPLSVGMDMEEIRCLSLCRDLGSKILSEDVLSRMDSSLMELSLYLTDMNSPVAKTDNYLFNGRGYIDYTGKQEIIESLLQAQEERKLCLVSFKEGAHGDFRERNFAPGRILTLNDVLYVLGADLSGDGALIQYTNLAIHRIKLVSILDQIHEDDFPNFDPHNFGFNWSPPRRYQIKFKAGKAAEYVGERIWSDNQHLKHLPDGSLMLTLTTRCDREIKSWIQSFGSECSLVSESGALKEKE
jgi:hypothetical protein